MADDDDDYVPSMDTSFTSDDNNDYYDNIDFDSLTELKKRYYEREEFTIQTSSDDSSLAENFSLHPQIHRNAETWSPYKFD